MATSPVTAEHLHNHVGQRASLPLGAGLIPITIGAVRHEPETGAILVDAVVPMGQLIGFSLSATTVVNVSSAAA